MTFLSLETLSYVLPALLLAAAAWFWAARRRRNALAALAGNPPSEAQKLRSNASPLRRRILSIALLASIALTGIAALRPSGGTVISEHRRPAKNLVLLVDVSKSMGAVDAGNLTRLEAAKLFAREFVNRRPSDRIGLLSFAGATFPECPTTLDRSTLRARIDQQEPGGIPVPGTDLTGALEEADALLTDTPPPGSALIVLSDGDNLTGDPTKIAKALAGRDIPVFTIGFGDPSTEAELPDSDSVSKADHNILNTISETTAAAFFDGTPATIDTTLDTLATRIDAIEYAGENIAPELYDRPLELYAYPLAAALALLFLHLLLPLRTKKWHPLTPAITLLLLSTQNLRSEPVQDPDTEVQSTAFDEALADAKAEDRPLMLVFTGSDWSPLSITFEREILSQQVHKNWVEKNVIPLHIDLPRTGISAGVRRAHRELASRFDITSFPTALFLDAGTEELGRLTHDPDGPAAWILRADAILSGDKAASDTAASVEYLPEDVRKNIEDPDISDLQRSVRLYNQGIELERAEPGLALRSEDRFDLLTDLYTRAADAAPADRADLAFAARHKLAILHHHRARSLVPDQEAAGPEEAAAAGDINESLKKALAGYRKALAGYRKAAPLLPGDPELGTNLAVLHRDMRRCQQYIDFGKAHQHAITSTTTALEQERRFRRSIDRDITTTQPVNDPSIDLARDTIADLVAKATAIKEAPTILQPENLEDYTLALEDITLAPATHSDRDLFGSTANIKDALDHLIDPQQQQTAPQQGEGEGEGSPRDQGQNPQGDRPDDNDGEGESEEEDNGGGRNPDADLRRSGKQTGDLRQRQLDRLGEKAKPAAPGKDR